MVVFTTKINKVSQLVVIIELEVDRKTDVTVVSISWELWDPSRTSSQRHALQLDSWLFAIGERIEKKHEIRPFCMAFADIFTLPRLSDGRCCGELMQ